MDHLKDYKILHAIPWLTARFASTHGIKHKVKRVLKDIHTLMQKQPGFTGLRFNFEITSTEIIMFNFYFQRPWTC